jgi:hypothetical protein
MSPRLAIGIVIILTTVWVGVDAHKLGVKRGKLGGGVVDMSVLSWVVCCFFLWIVSFPCYLVARSKYQAMRRRATAYPSSGTYAWPQQPNALSRQPNALPQQPNAWQPAQAPAPISPDGRWWWNGQQWMPMPAPVATPRS